MSGLPTQPLHVTLSAFCFLQDHVDKIVDNPLLDTYNVEKYVDKFVKLMTETYAPAYGGSDVLVTFGDDVLFESAGEYFSNLDQLIHYVNLDGRINMLYGTPAEYLTAKLRDASFSLPRNDFDFMPLEDSGNNMWTGYFTSRVGLKGGWVGGWVGGWGWWGLKAGWVGRWG